ncbi:MAG: PD-(D/E)XK nuclease domain-containing protein [Cyanobacteria bacterium LVE1205-1]
MLWQTGYLTFSGCNRRVGERLHYGLTYPNLEVQIALNDQRLKVFLPDALQAEEAGRSLWELLVGNNLNGLEHHFRSLFASIPHQWYTKNHLGDYEGYYASVFYSHFAALGLDLQPEDRTSQGRIDLTLRFQRQIYLFEFQLVERFPHESPLAQIHQRGYVEKFLGEGIPVYCIRIRFSQQLRNILEWQQETRIA